MLTRVEGEEEGMSADLMDSTSPDQNYHSEINEMWNHGRQSAHSNNITQDFTTSG